MKRTATAVWNGSLKEGTGTLTAPGGALNNTQYSFASRFASGPGTNPEELIAAAHAGCFAMALSAALGEAGFKPDRLEAIAEVSLDNVPPKGWSVTASHLVMNAKIPASTPRSSTRSPRKQRPTAPFRVCSTPTSRSPRGWCDAAGAKSLHPSAPNRRPEPLCALPPWADCAS